MFNGKDYRTFSRLEKLLYKELLKRDCYEFCKFFWSEVDNQQFVDNKLFKYLCEVFQYACRTILPLDKDFEIKKYKDAFDIRKDDKHYYSISIPPRHSKSITWNVLAPCWLFVNCNIKIASISHTFDLAKSMTLKRQMLFNSDKFKYFFGDDINLFCNSSTTIKNDKGGEMYSIAKQAITGFGCDVLIVDDLTNVETAMRDSVEMETAWRVYTDTLPSRLNNPKKFVWLNIMQRIAINDIVGRILSNSKMASQYCFITLPAIFEKETTIVYPVSNETYTFKEGDVLCDERYGDYSSIKNSVTDRVFSSQYLQRPQDSENAIVNNTMIKVLQESEVPSINDADFIYASHDFPVKDKDISDFLGSVLAYSKGQYLYIEDCLEKKMDFLQSIEYVKRLDKMFINIIQIIEDKANGSPILNSLHDEISSLVPYNPSSFSKSQRLEMATMYMQLGYVVFVSHTWDALQQRYILSDNLENLKSRLLAFPFVKHDDIVDAFSQLLNYHFINVKNKYYKGFNDDLIVKETPHSDEVNIYIDSCASGFKISFIGVVYSQSLIIVEKEETLNISLDELTSYIKSNYKTNIVIDSTQVFNGAYINDVYFQKVTLPEFEVSSSNLNFFFMNKKVNINENCKQTIADINNFRFNKNGKLANKDDGYACNIRNAIKFYGVEIY